MREFINEENYERVMQEMTDLLRSNTFEELCFLRAEHKELGNELKAMLGEFVANHKTPLIPSVVGRLLIYHALVSWRSGERVLEEITNSN